MTELRLTRPLASLGEDFVHLRDWDHYLRLHPALSALLGQAMSTELRPGFYLHNSYLELELGPSGDGMGASPITDSDRLRQLYMELRTVTDHLECCEIDPATTCLRLAAHHLPLLELAQYQTVIDLLAVFAKQPALVSPLMWFFKDKHHKLRVVDKDLLQLARCRAVEAKDSALRESSSLSSPALENYSPF